MEKSKLLNYIFENFTLERSAATHLVTNIVSWVAMQSMDEEDTVMTLICLLDGLGLEDSEIEKFVKGEKA